MDTKGAGEYRPLRRNRVRGGSVPSSLLHRGGRAATAKWPDVQKRASMSRDAARPVHLPPRQGGLGGPSIARVIVACRVLPNGTTEAASARRRAPEFDRERQA